MDAGVVSGAFGRGRSRANGGREFLARIAVEPSGPKLSAAAAEGQRSSPMPTHRRIASIVLPWTPDPPALVTPSHSLFQRNLLAVSSPKGRASRKQPRQPGFTS